VRARHLTFGQPLPQGDYYRYLAELEVGDASTSDVGAKAAKEYEAAQAEATSMEATNPIRLGLALNLSGACLCVV